MGRAVPTIELTLKNETGFRLANAGGHMQNGSHWTDKPPSTIANGKKVTIKGHSTFLAGFVGQFIYTLSDASSTQFTFNISLPIIGKWDYSANYSGENMTDYAYDVTWHVNRWKNNTVTSTVKLTKAE